MTGLMPRRPPEDLRFCSALRNLPSTRYRGSKRRHAAFIARELGTLDASRLYDAFGGSGSVTALADGLGVRSHYNDLYAWTTKCARVLFVHKYTQRDLAYAVRVIDEATRERHTGFIARTYSGCYFTHRENQELDGLLQAMQGVGARHVKDLLFYGIAQAALAKMPMSMFHRASLKQRLAKVPRNSRNETTWSTPFRALVPRFLEEAVVFSWRRNHRHVVTRKDALDAVDSLDSDEVLFLDPPYVNPRSGVPTYAEAYHFLEGFACGAEEWRAKLDWRGSHPIFRGCHESSFENPMGWEAGVRTLVDRAEKGSVIATARERDDPGARQLKRFLRARFKNVKVCGIRSSTIFSDTENREYLFLAT